MKVFIKSGAWSHFYSLWSVAVIFQGVNRGFDKRIMIHRDSRALRAPRSVIFPKRNPPHFCLECARTTAFLSTAFVLHHTCLQTFWWVLCTRRVKQRLRGQAVLCPCASFTVQHLFSRGRSWLRYCATAGRPRVRFRMVSLEFFTDKILPAALSPWGWLGLWQKWVPGIFPEGQRRPVRRPDNLTTFMCRLSWNLGASTSWNPQGLSRHIVGLVYLIQWSLIKSGTVWSASNLCKVHFLFSSTQ